MDDDKRGRTLAEDMQVFSQALNQLLVEITRPLRRPMIALENALARMDERYPLLGRIPAIPKPVLIAPWIILAILGMISKAMQ